MPNIKIFALGGLDKKSNDLTRSPEKASDMLNLEYDTQSSLKKRNGYDIYFSASSSDMIYYSFKNEIIVFKLEATTPPTYTLKIYAYKSDFTFRRINLLTETSLIVPNDVNPTISISYCEMNNNIYFTTTNGYTRPMVYDGSSVRLAGLLTPANQYDNDDLIINSGTNGVYSATTGSSYYVRCFYKYTDMNGNTTFGPYIQSNNKYNNGAIITAVGNTNNYLYFTSGITPVTLDSSNRSLTVGVNNVSALNFSNFQAGDKFIYIDNSSIAKISSPQNKLFVELEVETSSFPTSITFTAASLDRVSITFDPSNIHYVYRQDEMVIAISSSKDTGYYITKNTTRLVDDGLYFIPPSSPVGSYVLDDAGFSTGDLVPFEDYYDSTTLKIRPPVCRYIAAFGDQIAYGNVLGTFDENNRYIIYDSNDLFYYSDIGTQNGPENISPLNVQKVGETWDGEITGIRRCNDSLVVFKTRGVFSVDGALISGEYQLRKINTNFVGCTSHKSILESEGGLYFQGHNGIYYTNAIGVKKLTYEIDAIFGSAEYSSTRSVRLKKKQKALFYVPELSKIVVIDYYYNQVYMWSNIDASGGFIEDSLGNVFFSNKSNIYKFNDTGYSDNGTAINAYYSTTWHHAGEPSLNKKWLSLRVFALTDDVYTTDITTHGDWDIHNQLTSNAMSFTSNDQTKFIMLDMKTKRSFRITFSNNVLDENLPITGYELHYEIFNNVDKN